MVLRKLILIICLFLIGCSIGQPNVPHKEAYKIYTLNVDSQLTMSERINIIKATQAWSEASNYNLRFSFKWNFVKNIDIISQIKKSQINEIYFLNLKSEDRIPLNLDEDIEGCYWHPPNNGGFLLMFPEEFDYSPNHYYEVALHEIGHLIGLEHSKYKYSIMAPSVLSYALTKDDIDQLCNIVTCNDR